LSLLPHLDFGPTDVSLNSKSRLLVTAFEPFGGQTVNISQLALEHIASTDLDIRSVLLPCDSIVAPREAVRRARLRDVQSILLLGEDRRFAVPTVETECYNWLNYDVSDELGRQPKAGFIVTGAPAKLSSPFDARLIRYRLLAQGIETEQSTDPGRHLCNHVYFCLRHFLPEKPALLLHLPRLPEQQNHPSAPSTVSIGTALAVANLILGD
jgi:pyroglutamyl-peptidase